MFLILMVMIMRVVVVIVHFGRFLLFPTTFVVSFNPVTDNIHNFYG